MKKLFYSLIVCGLFFIGTVEVKGSELKKFEMSLLNSKISQNSRLEVLQKLPTNALMALSYFFMERFGQFIAMIEDTLQAKTGSRFSAFLRDQNLLIMAYKEQINKYDEHGSMFCLIDDFDKKCSQVAPVLSPVLFNNYLSLRTAATEQLAKILDTLKFDRDKDKCLQWGAQTLFKWRLNLDKMRVKLHFFATEKKLRRRILSQLETGQKKNKSAKNKMLLKDEADDVYIKSLQKKLDQIETSLKYKKEIADGEGDYKKFFEIQKKVESIYKSIKNELAQFEKQGKALIELYAEQLQDLCVVVEGRKKHDDSQKSFTESEKMMFDNLISFLPAYKTIAFGFLSIDQCIESNNLNKTLENINDCATLLNQACLFKRGKVARSSNDVLEVIAKNVRMYQDTGSLYIQTKNIAWEEIQVLANSMEKLCPALYYLFYTRLLWRNSESIGLLSLKSIEVEKKLFPNSGLAVLDDEETKNLKIVLQFISEGLTLIPLLRFFYQQIKQRYVFIDKKESIIRQEKLLQEVQIEEKIEKEKKLKVATKKPEVSEEIELDEASAVGSQLEKEIVCENNNEEELFYDKTYIAKLLKNSKRHWISKKGYFVFYLSWRGDSNQATFVVKKAPLSLQLNPLSFDTNSQSFYKNNMYHRIMRKLLDKRFFVRGTQVLRGDLSEEALSVKKSYGLWPEEKGENDDSKQVAIIFPGFLFLGEKAKKRYEDITKALHGNLPATTLELMFASMAQSREQGAGVLIVADNNDNKNNGTKKLIHCCFHRKR